MQNKYNLVIDFKQRPTFNIQFIQNDIDTSVLSFTVCDGGAVVDLTGQSITAAFLKPDNTLVIQDLTSGVAITSALAGKFEVVLRSQTLAAVGLVRAEISFSEAGKKLSTAQFMFSVSGSIDNGEGAISTSEIPKLDAKILETTDKIAEADAKIIETEEILQLVIIATTNAELATENADAAEADRASAESSRVLVESARVIAEQVRASTESTREANETARQGSESARASVESNRVIAEQGRVNAENQRVTEFDGMKSAYETATNENTVVELTDARHDNITGLDYANIGSRMDEQTSQIELVKSYSKIKRYGVRINKDDSNPETRIEYILDAKGLASARMNYTTGLFEYGSWGDVWFIKDNYPAMVKYDGTEDYKLDPNDYMKKLDSTASDVANSAYTGNAMSSMPLVWIKQYELDGWQYIILCEVQYDDTYKAYAHTRADGSIMDKIWLAMFRGSSDGTRLRSISGLQHMYSQTASTEITKATANGTLWNTRTWSQRNLVNCLLTVISKHDNSQTAFGNGNLNYQSALTPTYGVMLTGSMNAEGQFKGYNDNTHQVKVFHMEAWWADQWERIQGLLNINGDIRVKMTPPYNLIGTDFISTGLTPSSTSGGYINISEMTELGRVPVVASGSSATYQCDGLWFNNTITAVALVGGSCNSSVRCGLSYVGLDNSASYAAWSFGASLSCEQPLVA